MLLYALPSIHWYHCSHVYESSDLSVGSPGQLRFGKWVGAMPKRATSVQYILCWFLLQENLLPLESSLLCEQKHPLLYALWAHPTQARRIYSSKLLA